MNLWRYLAKRLLLMVPTVLGILLVTFAVIQFVPGGPVEQLAQQLRQAGAQVDFVVAYERAAPCLSAAEQRLAQAGAHDGSLWLFSSSEAVGHLRQLLPGQGWQHARALTTHPRIAQAAHAAGFGQVHHCKPALEAVVASIKSLP